MVLFDTVVKHYIHILLIAYWISAWRLLLSLPLLITSFPLCYILHLKCTLHLSL